MHVLTAARRALQGPRRRSGARDGGWGAAHGGRDPACMGIRASICIFVDQLPRARKSFYF